ncbi:Fc.00g007400.m01.CDS01 [Cosmosporella sp. VM-42]
MTPVPAGPGSPLIAGAVHSGGDFNDFSDDELNASNFLDFSNSPDTLQTLDTLGANEHKSFLTPQELTTGPLPDSPNGSYQSSSSERASSKRTGSSASLKAVASDAMEEHDVKMEWPGLSNYADDDVPFTFGSGNGVEPSGFNSMYGGFDGQDDNPMGGMFDFFDTSSTPETTNGGQTNMSSPNMPIIRNHSPRKSDSTPRKSGSRSQGHNKGHNKGHSQISTNGFSGSREVSPMSNIVMSQDASPAGLLNSPAPHGGSDFSRMNGALNGNTTWSNSLGMTRSAQPDGLPTAMHFGIQMGQHMHMPQQLPIFEPTPFNSPPRYELVILPTPLKSRVETQIPIKLNMIPLPPGVTKLHLPAHTISKPKLLSKPAPERSPDMLELSVTLVCTSAMQLDGMKEKALERAASHSQNYLPPPNDEENLAQNGGEVRICSGCITRERKRAARKKVKKPEDEKIWSQDEDRRVIVFNTSEVKEWQPLNAVDAAGRPDPKSFNGAMQIDAPMRIACYCRHHSEKMGFNVIFTIKDHQDNVIAQAMSKPIMITDDHKTHPQQGTAQPLMPEAPAPNALPVNPPMPMDPSNMITQAQPTQNGNFRMSPSNVDLSVMHRTSPSNAVAYQGSSGKTTPTGGMSRSRPPSPIHGGPATKKRKASSTKIPADLTMTRLNTSESPSSHATGNQISAATSPFSPNMNGFPQNDQLFAQQNGHASFSTGPPTPSNEQFLLHNNRSASMDNLALAHQLYSAPASNHPSRAPSPNGLRNSAAAAAQATFASQLTNTMFGLPMSMNPRHQVPLIHKIIPNEGPMIGGIEVTILGAAFFQGLEVCFGDQKATTTTFWGDSSLVCLLPPSAIAGPVPVSLKSRAAQSTQTLPMQQTQYFKYVDDNEDKLIRTALSVVGHKMSGRMFDVSDLARRILDSPGNWGTDGAGWGTDGSGWGSGGPSGGQSSGGQVYNHASYAHLESQLLKCLDLIDLDDSMHRTRLDLKGPTGHTMLHLACSLGYHRFVAALLARGANPDARDKGGFTPLHMAAMQNHPEIVRRLMLVGADPTAKSLTGLTGADVAQSRNVLRAIRRSERHVRSRSSGGSLHSRTSSATSLRSLWEPLTKVHTHEEPLTIDSSEESPEYTSGDFEDEDPDENNYLSMRRPSGFVGDRDRPKLRRQDTEDLEDSLASPTTAMAVAFKDHFQQQFHQFQQAMALHLPQMQIPTFPGMPMLPDYQAYLQQAPFMRRVTQMMPGMGGPRPDTGDADASKLQNSWWDSLSKTTGVSAPPAYEDIYPQEELDRKHASGLQAAVEAAADDKCARLYDLNEVALTSVETKSQAPTVLQIGRKNAITKQQQEQFLKAREEKLKRLSSDRNLFFIWIPLLLAMVCAMLYSYFPSLFPFAFAFIRSLYLNGIDKTQQLIQQNNGQVLIPAGMAPPLAA